MAELATILSLVSAPAAGRTFVDFDDALVRGDASTAQPAAAAVLIVRAPPAAHVALIAHTARRLRTSGWLPIDASRSSGSGSGAPLFREVAIQLGLAVVPSDPHACAGAIEEAAASKRAAIVARLPQEGSWDRVVATELARNARAGLIVFVTGSEGRLPGEETSLPGAATFELAADLSVSDKLRWLGAVAEEAHVELPSHDIRTLEAWWAGARRVLPDPTHATALDGLSEAARAVLACLALAGRSLPVASLASVAALRDQTGSGVAAVDELVVGALALRSGVLLSLAGVVDTSALEATFGEADRLATAALLTGGPGDPDPWAYARAAELLVAAGAIEAADDAIARAVRAIDDAHASHEIMSRWLAAVTPVTGEGGLFLRVQAARRALAMGEANEAQRWCQSATALHPEDATVALLMGTALMQLGDLVSARVSLDKAQAASNEDELRARVASELAELSYLAGDLELATSHANRAIGLAKTGATRLSARNTIGKISLAEASWDAADAHFAEDVLTASAAGDRVGELRARLNRGIALMSKGSLDDARLILTRVLEDGKNGEDRACAYAFANLGVIAFRQRDYASALAHWEQAIRFRYTLCGRIASARTIANLAELRLRLGLTDHAEHAIAFGRRLLGSGTTAARASHFSVVAARIALSRGNSAAARREIDAALADGKIAGDQDYLGEAWRVAARVALDDGDVNGAAGSIEKADHLATNDRARADLAIVRALHLRATGQRAIATANTALSLARTAGEEDLLGEIYMLLAELNRDAGDIQIAQDHCGRAIALRDQVAASLPSEIRAAFLAKRETVALSRLQTSLASQDAEFASVESVEEEAPRTQRNAFGRAQGGPAREIIGEDPQVRSLLVAIRKVARSNSTILIRGESGTGKELVAEALHRASERAAGPLVSVNCAALVEDLLLSELFGHEKGAFTGAASRRRGRFEMADGGTLFLDEIGDISTRTQVALLRVLQEKTFERVGGAQPIRADVRVICATHCDLKGMVERGQFREDLYYRLKGITLEVPALRARLGDLPKIAHHLLGRIATERSEKPKPIATGALELLQRHRWPGNIRELENVLRAVSLFAEGDIITASDIIDNVDDLRALARSGPASQPPMSLRTSLPPAPAPRLCNGSAGGGGDDGVDDVADGSLPAGEAQATAVAYAQVRHGAVSLSDIKRQIERDCIARALLETNGNITRAAAILGMKRPRLSQLVKQYGLATSSEGSQ